MDKASQYAHALLALTQGAEKETAERRTNALLRCMKRKGHHRLMPRMLRIYRERVKRADEAKEATLSVARESDLPRARREAQKVVPEGAWTMQHRVRTEEDLIGGFVYQRGDTLVDASYKRALVRLYRALVR